MSTDCSVFDTLQLSQLALKSIVFNTPYQLLQNNSPDHLAPQLNIDLV